MTTSDKALRKTTDRDRFGLTFSLALLLHAIIILGLTFQPEERAHPSFNAMKVVLVQQKTVEPEATNILAQANLKGNRNIEEETPLSLPEPLPLPSDTLKAPQAIHASPATTKKTITGDLAPVEKTPPETLTVKAQKQLTPVNENVIEKGTKTTSPKRQQQPSESNSPESGLPSAQELLSDSFKLSTLNAAIDHKVNTQTKHLRRKWVSANTKEYNYAAYMEAWRTKVERVGNLNYPEQAKKKNISGTLVLDVAIRPDGTVEEIMIRRSSGEKVLDDAAIHTVQLAAPFAPLPEHIKADTDILHIIRTWQFINKKH